MAKNNAIVEIQGTDLISESMHKINDNFKILAEAEEQDRYKWQTYVDSVNSKIEELKALTNSKNSVIEENIHTLADEIKNIPTIENLQKQVTEAIENASDVVANVIATNAGDYISSALTGYVKTTSMNDELRKYVLSTGFEEYKSDANKRIATANRVVANSTFATTNDGYFIYLSSGEKSQYNSIESYYNAIKSEIDPTNKGINDTDVYDTLLARCESTFKTVVNEITTIRQEVGEGTSSASIVAAVKGALGAGDSGDDAEDIAASIFAQANKVGSSIRLRANQIDLSSDSLNVTTGQFTVNADDNDNDQSNANFRLKANGDVTVKGNIAATSGKIGNVNINNGALTNGNFTLSSNGKLTASGVEITGTITATGGLISGNLLVGDSDNNVTAGILGTSTSNNDLRFFAGSNLAGSSNAPFRVYEDGKIYAKNAEFRQPIIQNDVYESIIDDFDKENVDCSPQYVELDAQNYRCFNIERNAPIYIDAKPGNNNYYYEEFGGSTFEFKFSNLLQNVIYTVAFKFKHQSGQECTHNHISMDAIGYDAYNKLGVVVLKVIDTDRNIEYVNRTTSWTATTYEIWKSQDTVSMGAIIDAYNGQYGSFQFMVTSNNEIRILNYYADWITFSYRYR